MPVLAEFSPQGQPGQAARSYIAGREASESWMDRAQNRESNEQAMRAKEQQIALNELLLPVKQAQAKADIIKAKTELDGAVQTQGAREASYALLDSARQDFDFINRVPDDRVRARMSREWLSRYSQLANVAELADEMKVKNHLATSNIMDAIKIAGLGSAEARAFESLTEGMSPEDKEKARRVKLGLTGRQSGAAIQYREVVGPNGEKLLVAVDPRSVGTQVIGSGQTYGSGVNPTAESEAFARGEQPSRENVFRGQTTRDETLAKETAKNEAEYKAKLAQSKPKRAAAIKQAEKLTDQLTSDIDSLISNVTTATAGPGGVILDKFPGTSARDLQANLDSVKANIGFQALQAMREASPTGGALGQVSDSENKLLQSRFGALEIGQSPKQLIENLKKVRQRIVENFGITRSAFENEYGEEVGAVEEAAKAPGWDESKEKRLQELKAKLGK